MSNQIYADLAKVMRSVDHVGKGDFNSHQKFSFRGIDGVLNAVGPALREHNVVVYPRLHDVAYEEVKTSGGKASTACRVVVDYIFASVDGSTVETRVAAESWDTGDKAMPKAMSVAMRTALIQALALPTDEPDPDSFTYTREAEEGKLTRVAEKAARNKELKEKILAANTVQELHDLWPLINRDEELSQLSVQRAGILKGSSNGAG